MRRPLSVLFILGLISAVLVPSARADDVITSDDQPYYTLYNLKNAREHNRTGKGVTIAILDTWVDMSAPELAGANVEIVEKCPITTGKKLSFHGTAVTSILASRAYGWAPDAKYIVLPTSTETVKDDPCMWTDTEAIHEAIFRDVDFISLQIGALQTYANDDFEDAVYHATARDIVIIQSAGNEGSAAGTDAKVTDGVVAISSVNKDFAPSEFSSFGRGTSLSAYGEDITVREQDPSGALGEIVTGRKGTSYAAPMVTGLLALGKDKWSKATNLQLLRSLVSTAAPCASDKSAVYCGFGTINPGDFMKQDPTTLEDSNPLLDKYVVNIEEADQDLYKKQRRVNLYKTGRWTSGNDYSDRYYVYRGSNIPGCHDPSDRCGSSPTYMKNVKTWEKEVGLL